MLLIVEVSSAPAESSFHRNIKPTDSNFIGNKEINWPDTIKDGLSDYRNLNSLFSISDKNLNHLIYGSNGMSDASNANLTQLHRPSPSDNKSQRESDNLFELIRSNLDKYPSGRSKSHSDLYSYMHENSIGLGDLYDSSNEIQRLTDTNPLAKYKQFSIEFTEPYKSIDINKAIEIDWILSLMKAPRSDETKNVSKDDDTSIFLNILLFMSKLIDIHLKHDDEYTTCIDKYTALFDSNSSADTFLRITESLIHCLNNKRHGSFANLNKSYSDRRKKLLVNDFFETLKFKREADYYESTTSQSCSEEDYGTFSSES